MKWRVRTRIVENVTRTDGAALLCLALNRYAAGWSFAYDAERRTVDALVAICAPPSWDKPILRLSEKAKLSAWMSDVLAERLADAVGGTAALSHPRHQPRVREKFDGTYHYLETLRGRPEWVLDLTRQEFPGLEEIAAGIAQGIGSSPSDVHFDGDRFGFPVARATSGVPIWLYGQFGTHPIVGSSWNSAVVVPVDRVTSANAAEISAMTWRLFDDLQTDLLGAWSYDSAALVFNQWNTMSEVKNQEQLGSFHGHSGMDLWEFTSTLNGVVDLVVRANLTASTEPAADAGLLDWAAFVIGAIGDQAQSAVQRPSTDGDHADRGLLWLERKRIVAAAAWFNPMGPTVATLEVCSLPDGTEHLVYFMRHPYMPQYRSLGVMEPGPGSEKLYTAGINTLLDTDASLPNVLVDWNRPEASAAEVPAMLRSRVLEVARHNDVDLAASAAWVAETMGNPWDFAPFDTSVKKQFVAVAREKSLAGDEPDRGFATWWEQVSKTKNLFANFRYLPDAWDGSLNYLQSQGNLGQFDAGPLLVTYSTIGTGEEGV